MGRPRVSYVRTHPLQRYAHTFKPHPNPHPTLQTIHETERNSRDVQAGTPYDDGAAFLGDEKTSLSLPNMLVRRLSRCEPAKRLDTVSFPFPFASFSFTPSSLAPDSTEDRPRECREESDGKRIFFSFVGVVVVFPAPLVAGFGDSGTGAASGLGASVAVAVVPFTAAALSSAGVTPFVSGLASEVPFAAVGSCVEGFSSTAVGSGAGTTAVSAVVLPSTTKVSSGLDSETSATGTTVASVGFSVERGRTGIGTSGATGTGSEGSTAVFVISAAAGSDSEGSGAAATSGSAGGA